MDSIKLDTHLFICTNTKNAGESCGPKGAQTLRDQLKKRCRSIQAQEGSPKIRVNASGCLGQCEKGIAAVFYPQAEWLTELKSTDEEILFERLTKIISK